VVDPIVLNDDKTSDMSNNSKMFLSRAFKNDSYKIIHAVCALFKTVHEL